MKYDFSKITALVDKAETIFVTGHINPDCDAVGSSLAIAQLLMQRGKKPVVIYHDEVPSNLHFLPYFDLVISPDQIDCKPDLIILNDCATPDRVEKTWIEPYLAMAPAAVIDHHAMAGDFDAEKVVVPTAAACGQLVYDLALDWNADITPELATCLFAAISADTGGFRFANTTQEVFQIGADLMGYGVDTEMVRVNLFESRSKASIAIMGTVFSNIRQSEDKKLVWSVISLADKERCGASKSDCASMSGYTLYPLGVKVGILFEELEPHKIKFSMRSRPGYNVAELAKHFGGGGHKLAAGCRLFGHLDEIVNLVLDQAIEMFDVTGVVK